MLKILHKEKEADLAPAKKKAKAKPVIDLEEEDQTFDPTPTLSKVENLLVDLQQRAGAAKHHAAVDFWGCPRCRWSRSGCSYYGCLPLKFEIHKKKLPEKYQNDEKTLKIDEDK